MTIDFYFRAKIGSSTKKIEKEEKKVIIVLSVLDQKRFSLLIQILCKKVKAATLGQRGNIFSRFEVNRMRSL